MATLFIDQSFQFKGTIFRCGENDGEATMVVSADVLKEEKEKGKHPVTKKWMSPLFNHCSPADDESAKIFEAELEAKAEVDDEEEVERLRGEFDKIGRAYDKRWQLKRLNVELLKAQKEAGV